MGVAVGPMIELEADDAMASAAAIASRDTRVDKICIWTPDKDLAQCVDGDRIVQEDRKSMAVRNAAGVHAKFDVGPPLRELALLFKKRATSRIDAPLFKKTGALRWTGPMPVFAKRFWTDYSGTSSVISR